MDTSFAGVFAMADAVIRELLESEDAGLVLSSDIGNSMFDLIAASAAESAGCDFVRSPSLLRHCSHMRGLSSSFDAQNNCAEEFVFGRIDGSLRVWDSADPLESYTPWQDGIETRSIDTWAAERAPLRLVHFGDPELMGDQLAGAATSIARDRPVLTLYPAYQDRARLLTSLNSLEYDVFNLNAEAANIGGDSEEEFGWIAVPRNKAGALVTAAGKLGDQTDTDLSRWTLEASRAAFPRQRQFPAIFGLPARTPLPLDQTIAANSIVCVSNCYPLESEDNHSWRWLGPSPRSRIALPCALPGPYMVELAILGSHLERGLTDCRIIVEGREMKVSASNSVPGRVTFASQLEPASYRGYMEIDVVSSGPTLRAGRDPRTLRICIEGITVSHWQ